MPDKHHYVPQFYLRRFKSQCRRINIHVIHQHMTKQDVSIKDQCRKPNYYQTAQIEGALAEFEGQASIAISSLCEGKGDHGMDTIRQFIAVQHLRTPSLAEQRATMHRKMQEIVGEEATYGESTRRIRFDAIEVKDYPVYNLLMVDRLAEVLRDLKPIVVETASDVFITSDNPVFKYNQYFEDIQNHGITGLGQTGIQIFLPLSPKQILVLYDKDVYDYVKKQPPTEGDVDVLNGLQVISADSNLYFNDWKRSTAVEDLVCRYAHLRQHDYTTLDEFISDENPGHSLIVSYEQTPNVGLNLSFLRIKRRASRIRLSKRLQNQLRPPYRHPTPRRSERTERFSTRAARR